MRPEHSRSSAARASSSNADGSGMLTAIGAGGPHCHSLHRDDHARELTVVLLRGRLPDRLTRAPHMCAVDGRTQDRPKWTMYSPCEIDHGDRDGRRVIVMVAASQIISAVFLAHERDRMSADASARTVGAAAVDPRAWAAPTPSGICVRRRSAPGSRPMTGRFLRFDVIAGATIWGLLIPEMIAYARLAGLPPQAGLYTLLASLALYAIFGTSRHLVVAGDSRRRHPRLLGDDRARAGRRRRTYATSPRGAGAHHATGPVPAWPGCCGSGSSPQFLSRPVMEGFVFGLAIFVTVSQLPEALRDREGRRRPIQQLGHLIRNLGDTSLATFAVGPARSCPVPPSGSSRSCPAG